MGAIQVQGKKVLVASGKMDGGDVDRQQGEQLVRMIWRSSGVFRLAILAGVCALLVAARGAVAYEVTLTGPKNEDLVKLLRGGSLLIEQSDAETPPDVREIVSIAQADYKRLLAVLYDAGYFGPTIEIKLDGQEAAQISSVSPPRSISRAVITVTPGRRFRFGVAEVTPLADGTVLPQGFKSGEVASVSVLQSAAGAAIGKWRDAGHAKAELADQQITARHDSRQVDARLRVSPGPRLRFGKPEISGTSAVSEERILEIAALPENEIFSPDVLEKAAARLRRTGTFRSVAMIEGEVAADGDTLPINVRVVDNKPRRFGFGAELATIEGLTVSGFWLHRNILGGAESLRFDAEIGGIGGTAGGVGGNSSGGTDYLFSTRFERPATFNEDTNLYILGEIEQEDEPNFFSRQATIGTGIERIASDERSYLFGVGLRRGITEDAFGDSDYTLFLVPTGAIFDYRDNDLNARRGFYADARLTPFLALSGTDSGLLTELDFRTYATLGSSRSAPTLALRAQLGSVTGPSLEDAPADFLFYSGGGGTVRGHEYQSLGVRVGSGEDDIVGGRSFLGLSAEVRLRSSGSLGYVGFVDAGYIGRNVFPDNSGEWHSGAGIGLRYATPIGPLRFDVAVPVSGDDNGSNFQLYFGIGHSF